MRTTRFCSWLLVGSVAAAVGCRSGSGDSPGQTGETGSGGVSASGGKDGSGGANGSGGATGGQNSGGKAGAAAGDTGGSTPAANSSGGQSAGGATGGRAAGGSTGSAGAQTGGSSGAGSVATGGVPATGGQGSGGKSTGGSTGAGGAATGGNTSGTGGRATGGSAENGGNVAGGASGSGGSAAGGASGTGGRTGNADASTSDYHPCPTDGTACKIMPFGDSITDGYNSDTPGGYRVELFRLAHSAGKNITFVGTGSNGPSTVDGVSFPPRHEGHSGWTIYPAGGRKGISQCLQANSDCLSSKSVMLEYTPHIVLLMIGTNDAIDNYDMANAPKRLGTLIDTIYTQLPDVLIVVAQPIPSRGNASKGDDTALSSRIKAYDDAIPAVVKARADAGKHVLLVDMFTPFNTSLLKDQWHPNLQGYVLLGTQWYSVLKSLL